MTEKIENPILEHLKAIRAQLDRDHAPGDLSHGLGTDVTAEAIGEVVVETRIRVLGESRRLAEPVV